MADGHEETRGASDPRIGEASALILRLALGEYAARGEPSPQSDEIDALIVGLNILAETLQNERDAREKAEALLRDELHAYEHAPGMFCSIDARSFELVKCNTTFARAVAIDKEQLVGRALTELVPEHEQAALGAALASVREGGQPPRTGFTLLAADGRDHPVLLSASWVGGEGGADRLRVIFRDVSRERSLEEQVRQGQKMDAIGRLASGVAHDFNNILTVIVSAAEQSKLQIGDPAASEMLQMILDASERAAGLTRQLLTFGRSDVVNPEVHDLNALVRDAIPMLHRPLAGQAVLEVELSAEPLYIRIDATQLTQVLLNLTFNALDAVEEPGTFRLTSRRRDDQIELTFTDDGAGMAPEVLERACEPFFTTKDASGGSGLGLAVCYGIVKRAGGELTIASTPGEGTTIAITLPVAAPDSRPESRTVSRPATEVEARRILVVDDAEPVRRLIVRALRNAGHEVLSSSDSAEAMRELERAPVDLLVTDVVMPGRGGAELARLAWAIHPHLPVVFVSGYTGDRLGASVLDQPNVRFLQKPFRAHELIELVTSLLDGAITNP